MKNARQLLEEFTASSFRDPKKAAEMFAEDGAFEMPYLDSLGFPWRYEGRERIEGFFKFVRDLHPDMDLHDVKVVCETPGVVVGEYEFTTKSSKTGRVIHQLFVGRLEAENGQIKLLRESINLVELGLAIYTNGPADYKALQRADREPVRGSLLERAS
jgi:ketosteroid isomerase-like protein